MTKMELIENVREINRTASIEFLSQFNEEQLQEYLDHLRQITYTKLTTTSALTKSN